MHVTHPDGEAKFWLTPEVSVATVVGLSAKQLKEAEALVVVHLEEMINAWRTHFPN